MTKKTDLLKAAKNAHMILGGFYEWLDRVESAGGTTSISGIAACHAMLKSMKNSRERVDQLVTEPLIKAIEEFESGRTK